MAADSTAVRAGRAFVEIFADDSALARGLKGASKKLKAWGAGLTAAGTKAALIGTAMISPFVAATKAFSDAGSQLVDMSQRTGVSVEALGGLKYAAEQSGATLEDLEGGIKNMHTALHDAASGVDTARKKFQSLHLSVSELKNLPADQVFLKIAEAISKIQNPSRQAALSLDLLGKKGMMLLPLMKAGAAGIKVMVAEAARLGIVMSTEDAIAAEAFGDATAKAMTQVKVAFIRLGAAILPILEPIISKFSDALKVAAEWINKNRGLVVLAVSVGAALLAMSYAVTAVGFALSIAGEIIGGVVTVFGFLGAAMASIAPLASPMGITLIAILGFLSGMVNWSKLAADAMFWLGTVFGALKDETVSTMSAIGEAIAAGNIQAAVKILWAFLNLEWKKGTLQLVEVWQEMIDLAFNAWNTLTTPVVETWHDAMYSLQSVSITVFAAINSAFASFMHTIMKANSHMTYKFADAWLRASATVERVWFKATHTDPELNKITGADKEFEAMQQRHTDQQMENWRMRNEQDSQNQTNLEQQQDQLEKNKNASLAALRAQDAMAEADRKLKREQAAKDRGANRDKAISEAEAELAKAREEWLKAMEDSKTPSKNGMDKLKNAAAGIMGRLGDASGGAIAGTFNSFGVRGLSTGGGLQVLVTKISELTSEVKGARREINDAPVLSPAG